MLENKFVYLVGIIVVLVCVVFFFTRQQSKKREKARKIQELLDNTDELTQISNTKYIDNMLLKEVDRSRRHNDDLSLVIIEIDDFQELKENYGQQFCKRVLKETAENLQERIRAYDVLARDKHRFLCMFPETGLESALLLAKRARAIVAAESYYFRVDGEPIHVTACIGITMCNPGQDRNITVDMINAMAKDALANAKKKGPNNMEYILSGNDA
ncbi:MAG TPA: GGDEF domain-containing protein [Gammaproteobacteria bacterium]|nr:GGDEF domain-containing protein [Gammaproteobacteria bacterium]